MDQKSGTLFNFMYRLVKILKPSKTLPKNWNGITFNCRVCQSSPGLVLS